MKSLFKLEKIERPNNDSSGLNGSFTKVEINALVNENSSGE